MCQKCIDKIYQTLCIQAVVITLILVYINVAFILWDFNPLNWTVHSQVYSIIVALLITRVKVNSYTKSFYGRITVAGEGETNEEAIGETGK